MTRSRACALALGAALTVAAMLPAQAHRRYTTTARVTYYAFSGTMADGEWTYPGAAACSDDIPLGTTVLIRGLMFTCADRGWLEPGPWIDTWGDYGFDAYEEIEVE